MSDSTLTTKRPQSRATLHPAALNRFSQTTSAQLIPHVRALSESLQSASEAQLRNEVDLIRREMARGQSPSEPHVLISGLALAAEALRRTVSVTLYDVQLLATIAMARNCIAQMQTGEGKPHRSVLTTLAML